MVERRTENPEVAGSKPAPGTIAPLRLYALLRADLAMSPGKAAAQAGHAFLESFLAAPPERQARYRADGLGTKVALALPPDARLEPLIEALRAAGLPTALVVDHGHVLPPHFTGAPVATAIGVGPIAAAEAPAWIRRLRPFGREDAR